MEKSSFFNSVGGDRKYDAKRFAEYFGSFIGNGVFPNPSTNLQVLSNNDMTVTIKAGLAWINGHFYQNTDDLVLSIDVADGVLKRIDRIVVRLDTVGREITASVKKGTFASAPVAKDLQRDADAYELGIADILISNGAVSITQANITDLRMNSTYCGIVTGTVDQIDATNLFAQYDVEFRDWFATLEDVLDENTAANLLNLINQNTSQLAEMTYQELSSYASNIDDNGAYKTVTWKRKNGTTYAVSALLGTAPYTQVKIDYYNDLGTTIVKSITWDLTYDDNEFIYNKVVV